MPETTVLIVFIVVALAALAAIAAAYALGALSERTGASARALEESTRRMRELSAAIRKTDGGAA